MNREPRHASARTRSAFISGKSGINTLLGFLVVALAMAVPAAWWAGKASAPAQQSKPTTTPTNDSPAPGVEIRERIVEKIVEVPAPPDPLPDDLVRYRSRMDAAKLFNGINVNSKLISEKGDYASVERETDDSYQIDFELRIRVPEPNSSLEELASINSHLPAILPDLGSMLANGKVSGFYHYIYDLKQRQVQSNITRLESALSRHNFYDCETILELEHPDSGRKVLLLQGEMDVVSDGSDGDRMPTFDDYIASSQHFQPTTSYGWPKQSSQANPLVERMKKQLAAAKERYKVTGLTRAENARLESQIKHLPVTIEELKARSFLIAQEDPFVVIPLSTRKYAGFHNHTPLIGDYAVVIHEDEVLPAIVGDYGPTTKTGEASLRITKHLDPRSSPYRRPVSDLTVTYVIFPNSRKRPFAQPNLDDWHDACATLLTEIGGLGEAYKLHKWKDNFAHLREETSGVSDPAEPAEGDAMEDGAATDAASTN